VGLENKENGTDNKGNADLGKSNRRAALHPVTHGTGTPSSSSVLTLAADLVGGIQEANARRRFVQRDVDLPLNRVPPAGAWGEDTAPPQRGTHQRLPASQRSLLHSEGHRRGLPVPPSQRGPGEALPTSASMVERPRTGGRQARPAPPRTAPLPVSLTRCQHGEKQPPEQPPPGRERGPAAPRSGLHPPAAPGAPRRRHLPSSSASSAAAMNRRRRKPLCAGGRTDTRWLRRKRKSPWGHFRGADVEGRGGAGAEARGGGRC